MTEAWIQTFSSKRFYPFRPIVEDIDIEDIAHALSHQCRFTGHLRCHYSVAQHSCLVSDRLRGDRELALWGLLHDASEAYLQDLAKPVKDHPALEGYRQAEKKLQAAICERFGLPTEEPHAVRAVDRQLCDLEARSFLPGGPLWLGGGVRFDSIEPWSAERSKGEFLARFVRLCHSSPAH